MSGFISFTIVSTNKSNVLRGISQSASSPQRPAGTKFLDFFVLLLIGSLQHKGVPQLTLAPYNKY
jgi:hypothetical protein